MNNIEVEFIHSFDGGEVLSLLSHCESRGSHLVLEDNRLFDLGIWGTIIFMKATINGKYVGGCLLSNSEDNIQEKLFALYVLPNFRRMGVAKYLIQEALSYHNQKESVSLSTNSVLVEDICIKLGFEKGEIKISEYSGLPEVALTYYTKDN